MKAPRPLLIVGLLVLLSIAVLAPAVRGPFLHEDVSWVANNPRVHGFAHTWEWLSQSSSLTNSDPAHRVDGPSFYQPLVLMSFAFDWALGQGLPLPFHVTNLFFHLVASVLAYLTLDRWAREGWPPVVGALLFALHPAKICSVAWISGRSEILCAVGILMTLRGLSLRLGGRSRGLISEVLGGVIAFGAGEGAVILPLLAAVEVWASAGRPSWLQVPKKSLLLAVGPYSLITLAYLGFRGIGVPFSHSGPEGLQHGELILESLGRLTGLVVWPGDLTLSAQMAAPGAALWATSSLLVALGGVVLIGGLGVVAQTLRRWPVVATGMAVFLLAALPGINLWWSGRDLLLRPGAAYLPMLGVALLVAEGTSLLGRPPWLGVAVALLGIAGLGVRAGFRAQDFSSDFRFWESELVHPAARLPGLVHFARQELAAKRPRAALALAKAAIGAPSTLPSRETGELLQISLRALERLSPDLDTAQLNQLLGFAKDLREGRESNLVLPAENLEWHFPAAAPGGVASVADLVRMQPGDLELLEAQIQSRLGDDAAAKTGIVALIARCPSCWNYRGPAALVLARAGDFDGAEQQFERLRLGSPSAEALELRDQLLEANRARKSIEHLPPADRVRYETRYLGVLGAWGRAFARAKSVIERGPREREFAEYLGEVAYRAGDRERAQKLLQKFAKEDHPEPLFERWSLAMQWTDAPRSPEESSAVALLGVPL